MIFYKYIYILFLCVFLSLSTKSQVNNKDTINNFNRHSPMRATVFSAVVPGLGQAYNKKYWKIPIAYVGIGAFSYLTYKNQYEFGRYKKAILQRRNGEIDEFYNQINEQALINNMDIYRKYRDLSIAGIALFYAIQIIDANVDAHLLDFDVSDNISFKFFQGIENDKNPYMMCQPQNFIYCKLKF